MKIKLYILTYDNEHHINDNLNSLFSSNLKPYVEINIINNHSNFKISPENWDKLNAFGNYKILHNVMQCDESWGYTTRNWNQAFTLGFKDLNNPDCDFVVCAQDDCNYHFDWVTILQQRHSDGLEFIACGVGDTLCSYTPQAIKTVGMWDERFSFLCWSEHDYFLRASSWLGYKCAIEDRTHRNLYTFNDGLAKGIAWKPLEDEKKGILRNIRQTTSNKIAVNLFTKKWGADPDDMSTACFNNIDNKRIPLIPSFIYYPHFEKDIDNLSEKGYIWI